MYQWIYSNYPFSSKILLLIPVFYCIHISEGIDKFGMFALFIVLVIQFQNIKHF